MVSRLGRETNCGWYLSYFPRSLTLVLAVMIKTIVVSLLGGLAFLKNFKGSSVLFFYIFRSLVISQILVSISFWLIFY